MGILNNSNAISVDAGYDITDSLRFRASANAYLNRTPSSAGNRKTWTFSCWVKRGNLTDNRQIIGAQASGATGVDWTSIQIEPNGRVRLLYEDLAVSSHFQVITKASLRDPSAWYHIVVQLDTTQSTATDRVKFYTNGVRQTNFEFTNSPDLNEESNFNDSVEHLIGYYKFQAQNNYSDFYLTEMHFVDGTALTASDFGETDDNGTWIPKKYTGSYGTNGFYLPMKPTTQATGFNTVLYKGTGATQSITGVGFAPDLVWIKSRNSTNSNNLIDSVRGATKHLFSNTTDQEYTYSNGLTSFNANGFTVGDLADVGGTNNYVAWCWDAGNSTVSNSNGDITSSVRANPSTGFSIVKYTGSTTAGDTVGHGLGVAPKLIIVKGMNTSWSHWGVYHASLGASYTLALNLTGAAVSSTGYWNGTNPTNDVFSLGSDGVVNDANPIIAYCFADVTGYQKIDSYTGNGSTSGPTITTGFRPAWLLIKRTDTSGTWAIWDATRNVNNPRNKYLHPDTSGAEASDADIDFNDNGFQIKTSFGSRNASGGTYIYLAIADTRDEKFNFDASGNKNNWTPNNINSNASGDSSYDLMSDVPTLTDEDTSNFATLNAVDPLGVTPTNGNLTTTYTSVNHSPKSTIAVKTGKWYMEWTVQGSGGGGGDFVIQTLGVISPTNATNSLFSSPAVGYYGNPAGSSGEKYVNNSASTYGTKWGAAGTYNIAAALDLDGGTITFYLNGVSQGAITLPSSPDGWVFANTYGTNSGSSTVNHNFGQRPFAYTPPTGFKKLNTFNLPDSTIKDGREHFDTALWTGNSSPRPTVSTLKFKPQFLWSKRRDSAANHYIYDTVRSNSDSPNKFINTNNTDAEQTFNAFTLADNGFTLATDNVYFNASGGTYVSWNWNTAGYGSSNTDGSITSTVSANPTAGFSVVTYTGTGSNATVGHGLGVAPAMVIIKRRDNGSGGTNWRVYHQEINSGVNPAQYYIQLNSTAAQGGLSAIFNDTPPTSTVFNIGTHVSVNGSGGTLVAYCFAEVEGYSKFGRYTGNGSTDGPFTYTGFRPSTIIFKRTDSTDGGEWKIMDSARTPYNWTCNILNPGSNVAENTSEAESTYGVDLLSNGFKVRASHGAFNASGGTYIYMAFAENPFKNSNAR